MNSVPAKKMNVPDLRNWKFAADMAEFSVPVFSRRNGRSVTLQRDFPDPERLLESAYETVRRYLRAAGCSETDTDADYWIRTVFSPTERREAYSLDLRPDGCVISAADTEGIRRGLYEFTDLLSAENGAFPPAGLRIARYPFLKTRLGRCPFSPIKRKPLNVDELLEETDYYPDGLLDSLARQAVNGIWIVTSLRDLGHTSFLPDDPQQEKRIAKLRRTARKCLRYGIRVYLLMIEPFGVTADDPLFRAHREMFSPLPDVNGEKYGYCHASSLAGQYLRELFGSIFREVPELGGVVNISLGERTTTCLDSLPNRTQATTCGGRCGLAPGEIMRRNLEAMRDGIRAGSPDAELFAWFYFPQAEPVSEWARGISGFVPDGVIPQFNFESGGEKTQLDRLRIGGDYWISFDGPSRRFAEEAALCRERPLSAKLQLGCGYELSIVPGIPVPGVVYRKYGELFRLGATHVMPSWYLGNFPNVMNRAAGLSAFRNADGAEEDADPFLLRLARPDWRTDAPAVVRAWKKFDAAYRNFPFSVMFQYYGPQNNMPSWKFHFLPDLDPLAMPWKPDSVPGGDAIGEALGSFTLDEVILLFEKLIAGWKEGVDLMLPLREKYAADPDRLRDIGITELLLHQFRGTMNLLRFYAARREFYASGDFRFLQEMTELVRNQQGVYREMIPLLEADSRLGFHGEALTRIVNEEIVRQAIADADHALETARSIRPSAVSPLEQVFQRGIWNRVVPQWRTVGPGFQWKHEFIDGELSVRLRSPENMDHELMFWFMDAFGCRNPRIEFLKCEEGVMRSLGNNIHLTEGYVGETSFRFTQDAGAKETVFRWKVEKLFPLDPRVPFLRFNFRIQVGSETYFAFGKGMPYRLLLGHFSPHEGGCLEIPSL